MVTMCAKVLSSLGFDWAWDIKAAALRLPPNIKAAALRLPPNIAIAEMVSHNAALFQTYAQGVNRSTDLTCEEFKARPIRGYSAGAKSVSPKIAVH